MIPVASLQLRAGESLPRKDASKCANGLLSWGAKRRQYGQPQHRDEQFFHATVLEQRAHFVESCCEAGSPDR